MSEQVQEYSEYASVIEYVDNCEELPALPERFEITDKSGAAWAFRKLAKIKAEINENEAAANAEILRTEMWRDKENSKLRDGIGFFEYLLQGYFQAQRLLDPNLKHIKLPHGTIQARKQQPEYTYDDDLIIPWAQASLPKAVVTRPILSHSAVKAYSKETGEVIPGLTITERPEKISVEVI